jgi:hypothetical protein
MKPLPRLWELSAQEKDRSYAQVSLKIFVTVSRVQHVFQRLSRFGGEASAHSTACRQSFSRHREIQRRMLSLEFHEHNAAASLKDT